MGSRGHSFLIKGVVCLNAHAIAQALNFYEEVLETKTWFGILIIIIIMKDEFNLESMYDLKKTERVGSLI